MSETRGEERAPKRSASESCNPLHHRGILQLVLDSVGPGEHVFLSTVSKGFRACSLEVPPFEGLYCDHNNGNDRWIKVMPQMTICTSIFESGSRVRMAVELGFALDPQSRWCQLNAGKCADIETLVVLHEQYQMPYNEVVCSGAAQSGIVRNLQWLLDEQQCPQPGDICNLAALARTTDMLRWLKQRGCVFTADTCTSATESGYAASILQYLHAEGVPFDFRTMVTAINYQELPLLQWLYECGCPLSKEAAEAAAELVNLERLSWLHSVGCPCDYEFMCATAASYGDMELLQWIKDNGVVDWSAAALSYCLKIAGANGELDTAKVCNTPHADYEHDI
jgi:hypothetical protein